MTKPICREFFPFLFCYCLLGNLSAQDYMLLHNTFLKKKKKSPKLKVSSLLHLTGKKISVWFFFFLSLFSPSTFPSRSEGGIFWCESCFVEQTDGGCSAADRGALLLYKQKEAQLVKRNRYLEALSISGSHGERWSMLGRGKRRLAALSFPAAKTL